ncbi:MAG: hypothetical protein LBH81_02155 [Rickettsiales bacterium]|nr:hypothetical protein [Rickettsiales bacterium]
MARREEMKMQDVIIRKATLSDIPDLLRLQESCELARSDMEAFDEEELADFIEKGITIAAEKQGAGVVGFVMGELMLGGGALCQLEGMDEAHRNGLTARDLFMAFRAEAKARGARWIQLYAKEETAALHKYNKCDEISEGSYKEVFYYI